MIVLIAEDFRRGGYAPSWMRTMEPLVQVGAAMPKTRMIPSCEGYIAACERAEKMLLRLLSPRQRRKYRKSQSFTVTAASGRKYRILPTRILNVEELKPKSRKKVARAWCMVPSDRDVPVYDQMAAQMLLLQADEEKFKEIATRRLSS
jgi:hypothetical protein